MNAMEVAAGKYLDSYFSKRECQYLIPSSKDRTRCFCGRTEATHSPRGANPNTASDTWNPTYHTNLSPTDAYGTIEFRDGAHSEAQYLRLAFDTRADHILHLLTKYWGLELPKLVISVIGGNSDFEIPPKLDSDVKSGLLKAAKATGAWVFTGGTNAGVARLVGDALSSERSPRLRGGRVVSIGIAPWGVVENRNLLIGKGKRIVYQSRGKPRTKAVGLNSRHTFFLLADNGTLFQYGHEIFLRRRLEKIIANLRLPSRVNCNIPMVCVVVEGDLDTVQTVVHYVTDVPPVPVVIVEGTGKAADLIAYACRCISAADEQPLNCTRQHVIETVMRSFAISEEEAEVVYSQLEQCAKKKKLIHVFKHQQYTDYVNDARNDLDQVILTALLKSDHLSPQQKLNITLSWNRADLARTEVFTYAQVWPEGSLHESMMDALALNRVEFVKLLLEQGVSMSEFLTIPRLEDLYNSRGAANTLRYLVADIRPNMSRNYRYTLIDIGLVINKLMRGAYQSSFSSRKFRNIYSTIMKRSLQPLDPSSLMKLVLKSGAVALNGQGPNELQDDDVIFRFPFNELLVWAVLTKRHSMALLMWQHGEEALAKALMACCLYKSLAEEAADDDLEAEVCEELRKYAVDFEKLAVELADHCYRKDDDLTLQLLTCAQPNWGRQTCLHLAVAAKLKSLLAHPSAQILLADLWMGGLRTRKSPNLKVLIALLCPPVILKLKFKSEEELLLMPQTEEEYLYDVGGERADDANSDTDSQPDESSETDSKNAGKMSPSKRGSSYEVDVTTQAEHLTGKKEMKQLSFSKKIYEFYGAPITKFWVHSMAYVIFLLLYTYTMLIRSLPIPEWNEFYVFSFIVTFSLEKLREIAATDGVTAGKKLQVWATSGWNVCDAFAIIMFYVAFALRFDTAILAEARVIYSLNIVYWYVRILRILSVGKFLGPLVTLIFQYVYTMAHFVTLLCVFLFGYGVFRQSLLYPKNEPLWTSLRNVTYQPYFMIYGELFKEEIDGPCGEEGLDECVPGRWLNPLVMTCYLLMSIVLLLNMLIAVFNSIFIRKNPVARQIWMFQRYSVVLDYEGAPSLPPPFIIISHLIILVKWCYRRSKGKPGLFDRSLKLYLDDKRLERIRDFEEECMEELAREKEAQIQNSEHGTIRNLLHRIDELQQRVEVISSLPTMVMSKVNDVENYLKRQAYVRKTSNPKESTNLLVGFGKLNQICSSGRRRLNSEIFSDESDDSSDDTNKGEADIVMSNAQKGRKISTARFDPQLEVLPESTTPKGGSFRSEEKLI